jgi:hypothetical protein
MKPAPMTKYNHNRQLVHETAEGITANAGVDMQSELVLLRDGPDLHNRVHHTVRVLHMQKEAGMSAIGTVLHYCSPEERWRSVAQCSC